MIGEVAKGDLTIQYPFNKLGELLANMHCSIRDQTVIQFMSGKENVQPKSCSVTGIFFCTEKQDFVYDARI